MMKARFSARGGWWVCAVVSTLIVAASVGVFTRPAWAVAGAYSLGDLNLQNGWDGGIVSGSPVPFTNNVAGSDVIVNTIAFSGTQSWQFGGSYSSPGAGTPFTPDVATVGALNATVAGSPITPAGNKSEVTFAFKAIAPGDGSGFSVYEGSYARNQRTGASLYLQNDSVNGNPAGTVSLYNFSSDNNAPSCDTTQVNLGSVTAGTWHTVEMTTVYPDLTVGDPSTYGSTTYVFDKGTPSEQTATMQSWMHAWRHCSGINYVPGGSLKFSSFFNDNPYPGTHQGFYIDDVSMTVINTATAMTVASFATSFEATAGCGNFATEGIEECDLGSLINGMPGSCCNADCTLSSSSTVCRPGSGDLCDPAEQCSGSSTACPADVVSNLTTVCRPAPGACDVAENCTGVAGEPCPADLFVSPTNFALSGLASQSTTCPGSACPGSPGTVQASNAIDNNTDGNFADGSLAITDNTETEPYWQVNLTAVQTIGAIEIWNRTDSGSARLQNFYVFVSDVAFTSTTVAGSLAQLGVSAFFFPGPAGTTTVFEVNRTGQFVRVQLTGTNAAGENYLQLAEVRILAPSVCRTASEVDVCDVAENCTGSGPDCPPDAVQPAGTVCRSASGGVCDAAEVCDGVSNTCPADAKLGTSTTCRAVAGVCDAAEVCDGVSDSCPSDAKLGTSTTCRASAGVCDVAEVCDGVSNTCPADAKLGTSTTCRASAGVCDVAEVCDGVSNTCPADAFQLSTTTCRAAASECDVAENCTGSTAACPPDTFKPNSTPCTDDTLYCNGSESCNGSGACAAHSGDPCPPLNTTDANCSTSCDESTDTCTLADPNGTGCNDGLACDGTDQCNGGTCSVHSSSCAPHITMGQNGSTTVMGLGRPSLGLGCLEIFDCGFPDACQNGNDTSIGTGGTNPAGKFTITVDPALTCQEHLYVVDICAPFSVTAPDIGPVFVVDCAAAAPLLSPQAILFMVAALWMVGLFGLRRVTPRR